MYAVYSIHMTEPWLCIADGQGWGGAPAHGVGGVRGAGGAAGGRRARRIRGQEVQAHAESVRIIINVFLEMLHF